MASSSKPKISEIDAHEMADEWEALVKRLVNKDDREAFVNEQAVLYEKLVSPSLNFKQIQHIPVLGDYHKGSLPLPTTGRKCTTL
jgi:hypothetical protein